MYYRRSSNVFGGNNDKKMAYEKVTPPFEAIRVLHGCGKWHLGYVVGRRHQNASKKIHGPVLVARYEPRGKSRTRLTRNPLVETLLHRRRRRTRCEQRRKLDYGANLRAISPPAQLALS